MKQICFKERIQCMSWVKSSVLLGIFWTWPLDKAQVLRARGIAKEYVEQFQFLDDK